MTTAAVRRRAGATVVSLGGLLAAGVLLVLSGRTLPFPTRLDPAQLGAWADEVGGPTAAFTTLRALAIALAGWCAAGWVLGVLARVVRHRGAVRLTDRLSLPVVRRLADAVAGLAVVGATLGPGAVAAAPAPAPPATAVVTMTDLGPSPTPAGGPGPTTPEGPSSSVSTTIPSVAETPPVGAPSPSTATPPGTEPAPAADGGRSGSPGAPSGGPSWVIAPGDTLWHVAEVTMADRLGRPPLPSEIAAQLDQLVAANLDRLAVPDDPDLVFPGQEFVVP